MAVQYDASRPAPPPEAMRSCGTARRHGATACACTRWVDTRRARCSTANALRAELEYVGARGWSNEDAEHRADVRAVYTTVGAAAALSVDLVGDTGFREAGERPGATAHELSFSLT